MWRVVVVLNMHMKFREKKSPSTFRQRMLRTTTTRHMPDALPDYSEFLGRSY